MATYTFDALDSITPHSVAVFSYADIPAPPAPAPLPLAPQVALFPFPVDDPCCYSPCLVSCVRCSKNGRMYASAKTLLAKGA